MKASSATYWRSLASGSNSSPLARLLVTLLVPLALPYALVQRLRAGLYRAGILGTSRLPRPVVSVGNITVGGTGKTPVTACIARLLLDQGLKVAVLSRGYGGSLEGQTAIVSDGRNVMLTAGQCGDEPFLLASTIPGLMVVIGSNRHAAGMLAMERLSPDIFLLDDGFQHLGLKRDLNILLLDCRRPFGNGWTLPAGLLREPRSAADRADLIIHTRCQDSAGNTLAVPAKPACRARHGLATVVPLTGGTPFAIETLRGKKVLAFAGIAEPGHFFAELRSLGIPLVAAVSLPDHAPYDQASITGLAAQMQVCGAEYAVTTEKDGVKLGQLPPELAKNILLAPLVLTIDDPSPLLASLRNLLQK